MTDSTSPTSETQAPRITSLELSRPAVGTCWVLGLLLLATGGAATFLEDNQAGTAALLVFGGALVLLALMGRVPLRLEVGGAKLDATYEVDRAYDAGREDGLSRGLEVAAADVEQVLVSGVEDQRRVSALSDALQRRARESSVAPATSAHGAPHDAVGYRGPIACAAAAITYRQLDYWARTGLISPSIPGRSDLYSFEDVILLRITKSLLDAGISLQNIRAGIEVIRRAGLPGSEDAVLVSDGLRVEIFPTAEAVVDVARRGHSFFCVSVGQVRRQVTAVLEDLTGMD